MRWSVVEENSVFVCASTALWGDRFASWRDSVRVFRGDCGCCVHPQCVLSSSWWSPRDCPCPRISEEEEGAVGSISAVRLWKEVCAHALGRWIRVCCVLPWEWLRRCMWSPGVTGWRSVWFVKEWRVCWIPVVIVVWITRGVPPIPLLSLSMHCHWISLAFTAIGEGKCENRNSV